MAEYIDKQAFNDAVREAVRKYPNTFYNGLETARQIAHDMEAADVAPVRHGHWIGTEYDGYADGYPVYTMFECSECGVEYEQEEHYCPWCGARMDGDDSV